MPRYNYYYSAKQDKHVRKISMENGKPYYVNKFKGKHYTEMIEHGKRDSNFDDAVLIGTDPEIKE